MSKTRTSFLCILKSHWWMRHGLPSVFSYKNIFLYALLRFSLQRDAFPAHYLLGLKEQVAIATLYDSKNVWPLACHNTSCLKSAYFTHFIDRGKKKTHNWDADEFVRYSPFFYCFCTNSYQSKQDASLCVDIHNALTLATAYFQELHMVVINIPNALSPLPLSRFCLLRGPKRKIDSIGSRPRIPRDVSKPFCEEQRRAA